MVLADRFHWTQGEMRSMSNDFIEDAMNYIRYEAKIRSVRD